VAVVFTALPHGASAEWSVRARAAGARVVDLSSDLRPGHLAAAMLARLAAPAGVGAGTMAAVDAPGATMADAVVTDPRAAVPYGLPELFRDAVRAADVVANPGCYPTAVLVALAPLARAGLLAPGALVSVSAASGVTGAGNSPRADLLFGEVADDFRAYGDAGRRGERAPAPPRDARRARALGADVDLVFTPHLLPAARGILATITVRRRCRRAGRATRRRCGATRTRASRSSRWPARRADADAARRAPPQRGARRRAPGRRRARAGAARHRRDRQPDEGRRRQAVQNATSCSASTRPRGCRGERRGGWVRWSSSSAPHAGRSRLSRRAGPRVARVGRAARGGAWRRRAVSALQRRARGRAQRFVGGRG
jgi:hypothetical protein